MDFSANAEKSIRTAPQIRFQGACGAFYFGFCRDQIKNQPYKRRRVGRNLRLSRADPALCSGQPSPLRCILLSPQGLTTLRGPRLYGAYRRVGGSRGPPRVTFGYFSSQKSNPSPGRRTVCHPAVTLRRRRRDKIITFCQQPLSQPAADSSPYTGEPLGWGGATPLAQGSLRGGVTAGWLLEYHITVITLSKNDMSKKRFFCVTHN